MHFVTLSFKRRRKDLVKTWKNVAQDHFSKMKDDSRLVSCIAVKTKSQSFGARAYVMLLIQDGLWVSSLCPYSGSSKPACPPLNFHLLARMSGPSSSSSLDSSSFNFTSKFCVNSFLSHSAI